GNPNRPSKRASVIIFLIDITRVPTKIIKPFVGIQGVVPEDIVGRTMIGVGTRLGGKTLNASGRAPEFRGNCRSRDLNLLQCFDGRRSLVERGTAVASGRTRPVQDDFVAKILPAGKFRLEYTTTIVGRAWAYRAWSDEYKSFWRAQVALPSGIYGQRQINNLPCRNYCTDVRSLCLQRRRVGHNRERFLDVASLQRYIERYGAVDLYDDARFLRGLETRCSHGDIVGTGLHVRNPVSSG